MLNPSTGLCIAFHMVNQEADQLASSYYIFKHIAAALGRGDMQKVVILKPVLSGSGNPPLLSALRAELFGDLKQNKWGLCFSRLTRSVISLITSALLPKLSIKLAAVSVHWGENFAVIQTQMQSHLVPLLQQCLQLLNWTEAVAMLIILN